MAPVSPPPSPPAAPSLGSTADLHGRERDLEQLRAALQGDSGRVVVLAGMSQSGKSSLVRRLEETLAAGFGDQIVTVDAYEVPTVAALAQRLELAERSPELALEHDLRHHQRLIILDGFDDLFQPQGLAGVFRPASACYGPWLQRLAGSDLRGSLVLVSRAIPQVLYQHGAMRLGQAAVTLHCLGGWPSPSDRQWLEQRGVAAASANLWQQLLDFCGGYPELLSTAVDLILNRYRNDVAAFLRGLGPALEPLRPILRSLAAEEQALLPWLVLRPLHYWELERLEIAGLMPRQRVQALESLERRNLVSGEGGVYTLAPQALVHAAAELWVQRLVDEITSADLAWLHNYPLVLNDAPEWMRHQQRRQVLQPLAEELRGLYPAPADRVERLGQLITVVRQLEANGGAGGGDYALGNLLNLAIASGLPLRLFDVAGARLRQLDLSEADLTGWQATACTFVETRWPVPQRAPLRAALAPGGTCLAIGDGTGRVAWWSARDQPTLAGHYQFDGAVDALTVGAGAIAVAIGLRLYLWWPTFDTPPEAADPLPPVYATLPSSVACLAFDPDARHLAVGLDSGQVMAWDLMAETRCLSQASHSHPVCQVAFKADGLELLSYGLDNRIRCHRLAEETAATPGTPLEAGYKSSVIGIGWWGADPCAIERTHTSDRIIWRTAEVEYALAQHAPWEKAVCSGDGQLVAGYDIGGQVVLARPGHPDCPWPTLVVAAADSDFAPQALQLDAQGQRLLLWSDRQVELWDVAEGRCQWRCRETPPARRANTTERSAAIDIPPWRPLDLSGGLGIPPWHQRALTP